MLQYLQHSVHDQDHVTSEVVWCIFEFSLVSHKRTALTKDKKRLSFFLKMRLCAFRKKNSVCSWKRLFLKIKSQRFPKFFWKSASLITRFSLFFDSDKSTTALLRLVFSAKKIFINENGVVANTEKTLNRGVSVDI